MSSDQELTSVDLEEYNRLRRFTEELLKDVATANKIIAEVPIDLIRSVLERNALVNEEELGDLYDWSEKFANDELLYPVGEACPSCGEYMVYAFINIDGIVIRKECIVCGAGQIFPESEDDESQGDDHS